jgi:hypothetical protein
MQLLKQTGTEPETGLAVYTVFIIDNNVEKPLIRNNELVKGTSIEIAGLFSRMYPHV